MNMKVKNICPAKLTLKLRYLFIFNYFFLMINCATRDLGSYLIKALGCHSQIAELQECSLSRAGKLLLPIRLLSKGPRMRLLATGVCQEVCRRLHQPSVDRKAPSAFHSKILGVLLALKVVEMTFHSTALLQVFVDDTFVTD